MKIKKKKIKSRFAYYENLNLNKYVVEKRADIEYNYKLFSVLVHCGDGSNSGHYYAYIRPEN